MVGRHSLIRFVLLQMILAVSLSLVVSSGMKEFFHEPRPCENLSNCPDSYSFPSRHTAAAFAMVTVFSFWTRRWVYRILSVVAAGLVGYWRFLIEFHTLYDVFVGTVIGIVIGIVVYYLAKSRKRYKSFYK